MAGDLHIKITMMLLFANIALTLAAPDQVLGGNIFFDMNSGGQYSTSSQITGSFGEIQTRTNPDGSPKTVLSSFGLIDILQLLWGVIDLLFRMFAASLILVMTLPGVVSLVVGVPLVIIYGLAIVGWIK